jgi:hypothetical protein
MKKRPTPSKCDVKLFSSDAKLQHTFISNFRTSDDYTEIDLLDLSDSAILILYRVQPLLCNDHKIGRYTRAVSRQLLGEHVTTATGTNATMAQQQRNGVFCVVRAEDL